MVDKKRKKVEAEKSKIDIKVGPSGSNLPAKSQKRLAELEAEVALDEESKPRSKNSSVDSNTASDNNSKFITFWIVVVLTVVLSKLPFSDLIFTPLNQFATMIHEICHAVACVLTGGQVSGMTIVADGHGHGGLTFCHGGIPFIHVQAGYLGTAVVGALLVFLGQYKHIAKATLTFVGVLTLALSLLFMGQGLLSPIFAQVFMSIVWALLLSGVLIWAGWKLDEKKANYALLFLAIHTSMDSLRSIGLVFASILFSTGVVSDATIMQNNYFLPAIFWSCLWALISFVLLGTTFWQSYLKDPEKH